jgi:hypothetical protein
MLVADVRRARGRRWQEPVAVALACFAALAAMMLLPGDLRLLAVPLALVAGAAIERHRQGRRERPLSLADTPQEWKRTLATVGWGYALAALATTAAGVAVMALPEVRSGQLGERAGDAAGGAERAAAPDFPEVKVLRGQPGTPVRVRGASFTVFLPGTVTWAQAIRSRQAGRGATWVVVGVDGHNLTRRRFNPNALSYRLKDGRGHSWAPTIGGGTGPGSLGRTGFLERGEIAHARLGFQVPRSARRLTLVFEPVRDGSIQVQVPLARESGA